MPRTSDQNQRIRAATRAKLLDSAMIVFAERGYAHTSIRKIAEHAGVSVGLLYHYFPGKESLLQAVFDNCMEIISTGFAGVQAVVDPAAKITYLVRYIFGALQADRSFWGLFYSLRSQPAVMAVLGDSFRLWTGRLRMLFTEYLTQSGRESPEIAAYVLYSLIEGTIQQYLLDPEPYPLEAVVERIIGEYGQGA
ncbi:MAG: TetR/AcrR family transcriptional regulator [Anaerolineae bacterium]|nr:TetR/AcrR family transcriptional regulator [Anaerolineae bacterium]